MEKREWAILDSEVGPRYELPQGGGANGYRFSHQRGNRLVSTCQPKLHPPTVHSRTDLFTACTGANSGAAPATSGKAGHAQGQSRQPRPNRSRRRAGDKHRHRSATLEPSSVEFNGWPILRPRPAIRRDLSSIVQARRLAADGLFFNAKRGSKSELRRQVAVDFEPDADFHKCGSCPEHSSSPQHCVISYGEVSVMLTA